MTEYALICRGIMHLMSTCEVASGRLGDLSAMIFLHELGKVFAYQHEKFVVGVSFMYFNTHAGTLW